MDESRKNSLVREIEAIPSLEYPDSVRDRTSQSSAGRGWVSYGWLLLDRRHLIGKVAFRTLIIATLIAFLIPSKYDSTAHIMPPDQAEGGALLSLLAGKVSGGSNSGSGASPSSGLSSLAGNFLGMKTSGALFVGLLRSRTVQEHVVDRCNLQKVYWDRYKEDARKQLDKRTEIEEDRKSGVITVTVTDRNPVRSRDITQAYLDELDRLLALVSTSSARRERMFIEQRLATVKVDLEDAEKQFSAFASKNTALDIKEQGKAMVEAAAVLQGQLMAAQSELQGLGQIYTGNNVRVRSLRARVAELQNQLQKFGGTDASLVPDSSGNSSQDTYPSLRKLPLLGVEWADLYRTAKIQETVYEMLTQQYELARIQEAKEIPTVRIVDPANVPEKKSWPPRLLIITGVTALFTLGSALCVIAVESWHNTDPRDPRKLLAENIWDKIRIWARRSATRLKLDRSVSTTSSQV